jgi:hypothetical protein
MAIIIPILTQFDDKGIKSAVREFERAKTGLDKFGAVGKIFDNVGQSLTKNVTVPLAVASAGIYKAVQAASTLQESISKTDAVFAQNAKQIRDWAKTSSTAFGQSEQQALEAAASYGNLFQAFGLSREQATKFSIDITELAADLASFNNTSVDDALIALRSGLSGETEPLKRFGVALNDARLKEEALRMGLITTTSGTLPIAIKAQAAYALIMKDTALAQGDFARTSDGLANQQRILSAEVQNLVADFGTAFLPIALKVVGVIRDQIIPQVKRFVEFFKSLDESTIELGIKIAFFAATLGPLLIVLAKVISSIKLFIEVFKILQLALLTNPVYLVAAGLAVLVVALIKAWKSSDTFRQGVVKLGNAFIFFAEKVINFVIDHLNLFLKGINVVIKGLRAFGVNISEVGQIAPVALNRLSVSTVEASRNMGALAAQTDTLGMNVSDQVVPALTDMNTGLTESATAMNKAKDAAKNAAQTIVDKLEDSLRKAESALEDVKGKFDDFKGAIGGTITGILDFGKAAESEDFLKGLADQATQATRFADKVKQLVVLGLNERAIRQVLDAGFEAGSKIADSIIIGGTTVVEQINTLVDSVFLVADQVGEFGAVAFYDAGVKQAEAMVAGIKAELERAKAELKLVVETLPTGAAAPAAPSTDTGREPRRTDTGTKLQPGKLLTSTQFAKAANVLKTSGTAAASYTALAYALQNKTVRMAKGGIVTGPTNALIGEAGPEAVIPLSGKNAGGMGSTYNITVNAGIGTNGAQVGRDIVEAIRKYERSSGQVFVRV